MPKDTKTLGNNKARACESLGFAHKKGCANILTQPLFINNYREMQLILYSQEYVLHQPARHKCLYGLKEYFSVH